MTSRDDTERGPIPGLQPGDLVTYSGKPTVDALRSILGEDCPLEVLDALLAAPRGLGEARPESRSFLLLARHDTSQHTLWDCVDLGSNERGTYLLTVAGPFRIMADMGSENHYGAYVVQPSDK